MHWTEDCICNRWKVTGMKTIDFFKISDSRTELRCSRCRGLMGWWDEPSHAKKTMPFKRAWSEEECLAMK
jgi:hypothetical protein